MAKLKLFATAILQMVKTVNTCGTSMDAYSTGCYEDKGPFYLGEMLMGYLERIVLTV